MSRPRSGSKVETLRRHLAAIERELREASARERAKREADDRRRCLLAGQAALDHAKAEPHSAFAATLRGLIEGRAHSASARALFGLAANDAPKTPPLPVSGDHDNEVIIRRPVV
jgi:hypothetical protein